MIPADLQGESFPAEDCKHIRQIHLELLGQLGDICTKGGISYFLGPELSRYILHDEEIPLVPYKCKIYMKQQDYNRFCKVVGGSLDFVKYFWYKETVMHREPFLKGYFCKNATKITCVEQGIQTDYRIGLEVVCLYPISRHKILHSIQWLCLMVHRRLDSLVQPHVNEGSVLAYKSSAFVMLRADALFLLIAGSTGDASAYGDYSELQWTKGGTVYPKEWFADAQKVSYEGIEVMIPKGYQAMWEGMERLLKKWPCRVVLPVRYEQEKEPPATGVTRRVQMIELDLLLEVDRICRKHNLHYAMLGGTLIGALRHQGFIPWDDDIDISLERKEYERLMAIIPKEIDPETYFLQTIDTDPYYNNVWSRLQRNGTVFGEASQMLLDVKKGIHIDILPYDHIHKNPFIAAVIQFSIARLKTVMWSNKGKVVCKSKLWRKIYGMLSLIPKKWAYNRIIGLCLYAERHKGEAGYFLNVNAFEYTHGFCALDYDNPAEYMFEGHGIMTFGNWPLYIQYFDDFMTCPPVEERCTHTPVCVDTGDLYREIQ